MLSRTRLFVLLAVVGGCFPDEAMACTCVAYSTPREALKDSDVVFVGRVVKSERLPEHPRMRGRQRYAVTFDVERLWKGEQNHTVTLYDVDPGTDCMGAGYEASKEYLVFASWGTARDVQPDPDFFWYGWTDVLAAGSSMIVPTVACTPGGDTSRSAVRKQIRELGPGVIPARTRRVR